MATSARVHKDRLSRLRERYLTSLLEGDRLAAQGAVSEALAAGCSPPEIALGLFAPSLSEIGRRWLAGDIGVDAEHWATEVTSEEMARVRQERRPLRELSVSVAVAAVEGEAHALPARMVADLFAWRGWTVDFLGPDVPVADLLAFVQRRRPDLLALSVIQPARFPVAVEVTRRLASFARRPKILVGGAGATGPGVDSSRLQADALVVDAWGGVLRAEELVGVAGLPDLSTYLGVIGARIQRLRRSARLSQTELAKRAALARPYLSAVEQGKQNITLEVALRLAGALEISLSELLTERP